MRKWILSFLLLIKVLSSSFTTDLEILAIEYPPYTDSTMPDHGLSFEILKEAYKGSEFNVIPVFHPPARCELEFIEGRHPVSLYNHFSFTQYENLEQVLIQRVLLTFFYNREFGELSWETLSDLSGKKNGVLRLGGSSQLRETMESAGLITVELDSLDQIFRLLKMGRIDVAASVDLTAMNIIQNLFPGDTSIVPTEKIFMTVSGGPWFNMNTEQGKKAMEAYRQGKERIIRDGSLLRILEKYYGTGNVPENAIVK